MEIDVGLLAATVVSSGAGWYAGHYFERQRAKRFVLQMKVQHIESVSLMFKTMQEIFEARFPGIDQDKLVEDFGKQARANGLGFAAISTKNAAALGLGDPNGPNNKA